MNWLKQNWLKLGLLLFIGLVISLFVLPADNRNTLEDYTEGGRIYLKQGTIYAFKDDPEKEYRVVLGVFHITPKQYDENIIFFDTPEEAEKDGFKPSKYFAQNYYCFKEGKSSSECYASNWSCKPEEIVDIFSEKSALPFPTFPLVPKDVIWEGRVVANMTYGRIRVERIPKDELCPYFVVEDYNSADLTIYTGNIRVYGEMNSMDCEITPERKEIGLKDGQCIPWVIVKKIEKI